MQKVSVVYEIRDNRLLMQELNWPNNCVCCMENNVSTKYGLHFIAEKEESYTDAAHETKGYPISWNIPYCTKCQKHAERKSNILYALLLIVGLLWAALGYYIYQIGLAENIIAIILFVVSLGALIFLAYQINKLLQKIFLKSTIKEQCSNKDYAIEVTSQRPNITFSFYNDKFAQLFLSANTNTIKK